MSAERPRPWLQLCSGNRMAKRPDLIQQLQQAGAMVELVDCLDQCTLCQGRAIALVSGVYAFAATPDELCAQLVANAERNS